jgi:ribonuclease-3 family protein
MNSLVLAYIGDSVYELYIRKFLVEKGITKVKDLQNESIKYVSAKNQARFLDMLLEKDIFNEDEIDIIKRARNNKGASHPKNTDIITYKHATALEAIIGYLYINNNIEKIEKIMNCIKEC